MTVTAGLPFAPSQLHQLFTGISIPDPITFIVGSQWLDRAGLYPRQATLIKIVFLREDLLTEYDYEVIEDWEGSYRLTNGQEGIMPDTVKRMKFLRALGYKWFKEVLLIMGRRAGKGHITALCMAYVLWNYMAKGDPQEFYGVDRDKKLECLIFAGKRDQAKATVFGDLVNVITGSVCFQPYINEDLTEKLSIYAPHDFVRRRKMEEQGRKVVRDIATFTIKPRESTPMAGRGPTSFMQAFDEMAHITAAGANRSAGEVYKASKPSLDQFGRDAFMCEPSSPWEMAGQFYENFQHANEWDEEEDTWAYPAMFTIQLASWAIYFDWEIAHEIPMLPSDFDGDLNEYAIEEAPYFKPLKGAIQIFDDEMKREEKANPETFAVERRSKWATVQDSYLNDKKVEEIFAPWHGRRDIYGPPILMPETQGLLIHTYKAHGDPSTTNANFGFALAHPETDAEGTIHCVFDFIHHWEPADYPDHIVDYEDIEDWIWDHGITKFYPEDLTFDQWNSASTIQKFNKKVRKSNFPKNVVVYEKTATNAYNWSRSETAKKAINMGWVHAPAVDFGRSYLQAEQEMKFLQSPRPGVVDKPSTGPIQTKDVADCVFECIMHIVGEQANSFIGKELGSMRPGAAMGRPGNQDINAEEVSFTDRERMGAMSGFRAARGQSMRRQMGGQRRPRY